jgi:hypothetical protein
MPVCVGSCAKAGTHESTSPSIQCVDPLPVPEVGGCSCVHGTNLGGCYSPGAHESTSPLLWCADSHQSHELGVCGCGGQVSIALSVSFGESSLSFKFQICFR